uniref:Uncharacterized protein n=1 Tax=Rhizophora mucronata TaxID=61149 RepID=A0A2P2NP52_RHIMU
MAILYKLLCYITSSSVEASLRLISSPFPLWSNLAWRLPPFTKLERFTALPLRPDFRKTPFCSTL